MPLTAYEHMIKSIILYTRMVKTLRLFKKSEQFIIKIEKKNIQLKSTSHVPLKMILTVTAHEHRIA